MLLKVGAPVHGGHCLARPLDDPQGHIVFVRHALPGEIVRARMTHKTSKTWRADAVEIIEASPDRVTPAWAQAGPGGVGGAELSHVALPAQRTWKRWVLADCIRRIGGPELAEQVSQLAPKAAVAVEAMPHEQLAEASEDEAVRASAGLHTRTRAELSVDDEGRIGMHGFHSSRIDAVEELPLAAMAIDALGLTTAPRWKQRVEPGDRVRAVAPSGGSALVQIGKAVYEASGRHTNQRRIKEKVDASAVGLGTLNYSVGVDGFWQIHLDAPRVLLERVLRGAAGHGVGPLPVAAAGDGSGAGAEACADRQAGAGSAPGSDTDAEAREILEALRGRRVLELYSGAGLFSLPLALAGAELITLEGSERAVRDARRNLEGAAAASAILAAAAGQCADKHSDDSRTADDRSVDSTCADGNPAAASGKAGRKNGRASRQPDPRLHVGRVTPRSVSELGSSFGANETRCADIVILDPPRQGAGTAVMKAVAELRPSRVVMVACDPAAAARDLGALVAEGYHLTSITALDMFPHTHHMETLAVLER